MTPAEDKEILEVQEDLVIALEWLDLPEDKAPVLLIRDALRRLKKLRDGA